MKDSVRPHQAPQDVYARHLVSHRGYPLWIPDLKLQLPKDYQDHGLKIGDVGYVVPGQGCFEVLFNVRLPLDHDLHRGKCLPKDFRPVTLDEDDITTYADVEDAGCVIPAPSVINIEVSPAEKSSDYNLTLSSGEGALLILPQGADRHSLQRDRLFGEYARAHAVEWYRFVEEDLERTISHDALYLITGFYKSRSWILASFQESESSEEITARFKVTRSEGGGIVGEYSLNTTRHLDKRIGPKRHNGNANQAVYISGFKIAVRAEPAGRKKISVKADEPSVEPCSEEFSDTVDSQDNDDPKSDKSGKSTRTSQGSSTYRGAQQKTGHISLYPIPEASQPFHPSDIINRYLLQKEPSATMAITHDNQWVALLKSVTGRLEPHELAEEHLVVEALSEKYTITLKDGTVFLQSGEDASDIPDTDGRIGKELRATTRRLRVRTRNQTKPYEGPSRAAARRHRSRKPSPSEQSRDDTLSTNIASSSRAKARPGVPSEGDGSRSKSVRQFRATPIPKRRAEVKSRSPPRYYRSQVKRRSRSQSAPPMKSASRANSRAGSGASSHAGSRDGSRVRSHAGSGADSFSGSPTNPPLAWSPMLGYAGSPTSIHPPLSYTDPMYSYPPLAGSVPPLSYTDASTYSHPSLSYVDSLTYSRPSLSSYTGPPANPFPLSYTDSLTGPHPPLSSTGPLAPYIPFPYTHFPTYPPPPLSPYGGPSTNPPPAQAPMSSDSPRPGSPTNPIPPLSRAFRR